ncbi:unnamed protein product [Amoebophrya sp. A25]|nr:unnamed protein product [Amoebophrya sp. A25]|eukprot:GSA25T00000471001.1
MRGCRRGDDRKKRILESMWDMLEPLRQVKRASRDGASFGRARVLWGANILSGFGLVAVRVLMRADMLLGFVLVVVGEWARAAVTSSPSGALLQQEIALLQEDLRLTESRIEELVQLRENLPDDSPLLAQINVDVEELLDPYVAHLPTDIPEDWLFLRWRSAKSLGRKALGDIADAEKPKASAGVATPGVQTVLLPVAMGQTPRNSLAILEYNSHDGSGTLFSAEGEQLLSFAAQEQSPAEQEQTVMDKSQLTRSEQPLLAGGIVTGMTNLGLLQWAVNRGDLTHGSLRSGETSFVVRRGREYQVVALRIQPTRRRSSAVAAKSSRKGNSKDTSFNISTSSGLGAGGEAGFSATAASASPSEQQNEKKSVYFGVGSFTVSPWDEMFADTGLDVAKYTQSGHASVSSANFRLAAPFLTVARPTLKSSSLRNDTSQSSKICSKSTDESVLNDPHAGAEEVSSASTSAHDAASAADHSPSDQQEQVSDDEIERRETPLVQDVVMRGNQLYITETSGAFGVGRMNGDVLFREGKLCKSGGPARITEESFHRSQTRILVTCPKENRIYLFLENKRAIRDITPLGVTQQLADTPAIFDQKSGGPGETRVIAAYADMVVSYLLTTGEKIWGIRHTGLSSLSMLRRYLLAHKAGEKKLLLFNVTSDVRQPLLWTKRGVQSYAIGKTVSEKQTLLLTRSRDEARLPRMTTEVSEVVWPGALPAETDSADGAWGWNIFSGTRVPGLLLIFGAVLFYQAKFGKLSHLSISGMFGGKSATQATRFGGDFRNNGMGMSSNFNPGAGRPPGGLHPSTMFNQRPGGFGASPLGGGRRGADPKTAEVMRSLGEMKGELDGLRQRIGHVGTSVHAAAEEMDEGGADMDDVEGLLD